MHIISKRRLREFWEEHREAEKPLINWFKTVDKTVWKDFSDVRKTFNHADIYQDCVIFNVGGNKYRIIAKVPYQKKRVYIRFVLTHSEYDKDIWKEDC